MRIAKLLFSLFVLGVGGPVCAAATAVADSLSADSAPSAYDRRVARYRRGFSRFIPTHSALQYAGNIGVLSAGVGWDYHRRRWMTEFLVGYVPSYESRNGKIVLTLKQIYNPFTLPVLPRLDLQPLQCGLFLDYVGGEEFWTHEPRRYPKHYYGFSTGIRLNVLLGGQLSYSIPSHRRIWFDKVSLYYEFSTCDLYVVSKWGNRNLSLWDITCLGAGLRMSFF